MPDITMPDVAESHSVLYKLDRDILDTYLEHLRVLYWAAKCRDDIELAFDILKEFGRLGQSSPYAMASMDKPKDIT